MKLITPEQKFLFRHVSPRKPKTDKQAAKEFAVAAGVVIVALTVVNVLAKNREESKNSDN